MDPATAARALAIGRIVIGGAMVLAPRTTAAAWLGRDARTGGASVMTRATGVRDVLLGGMVLHTLDHPDVAPRWVASTGAMDLVDGLAAIAARDELPGVRGTAGIAIAAGAAALGFTAARGLRARSAAAGAV